MKGLFDPKEVMTRRLRTALADGPVSTYLYGITKCDPWVDREKSTHEVGREKQAGEGLEGSGGFDQNILYACMKPQIVERKKIPQKGERLGIN